MKAQLHLANEKTIEDVVLLCVRSKLVFLNLKTNQPMLKVIKLTEITGLYLSEMISSLASV